MCPVIISPQVWLRCVPSARTPRTIMSMLSFAAGLSFAPPLEDGLVRIPLTKMAATPRHIARENGLVGSSHVTISDFENAQYSRSRSARRRRSSRSSSTPARATCGCPPSTAPSRTSRAACTPSTPPALFDIPSGGRRAEPLRVIAHDVRSLHPGQVRHQLLRDRVPRLLELLRQG